VNKSAIILLAWICSCQAAGQPSGADQNANSVARLCSLIESGAEQSPRGVLLIGEVHGTTEIPRGVQCAIGRMSAAGIRVVLAVEIPADSVRTAILATGDKSKRLTGWQWEKAWDGRTSVAMLDLIGWAHEHGIEVTSFAPTEQSSNISEKSQSVILGDGIVEQASDLAVRIPKTRWKLVSLIGRYHVLKLGESDFADKLLSLGIGKPTMLEVRINSGTAWVCRGGTCGVSKMRDGDCKTDIQAGTRSLSVCITDSTASPPAVLHIKYSD